ncbi:serine/threonine-protein kinase Nek4-like [Littorina saxatilis]|uniref:non-specific serine/threonine protein kinase n=1 Tax=Littorina saxatilis TaxID=31220 RepID=A0AAN9BFV5_9CAEN
MDEFDRIKVIGKGSYGEVWLAKHKKDKKQYVLKRINLQRASKRERSSAEQEAKLLEKLKHPNIVSYKQSFETPEGMLYIAMQYCEGGDLYTRLKEQKGTLLEERQVVEWFVQIAMALQYMHERNILHRDLKTQNIFLTKSKIIKLGDLGIARVLEGASDMATTLIGTPYYMSPELFSNKPYNHKSDVWALGCCVYEMTTLKHAFNAKDMNSLVYKILKGKLPPMPRQYGQDLLSLMRSMLHQDPEKRPSVNRVLRDPYIKRNIAIFLEDTKRGIRRPASAAGRRPPSAGSNRSSPASTAASNVSSAVSSIEPAPSGSGSSASSASGSQESRASGMPARPGQRVSSAPRKEQSERDEPDSSVLRKNLNVNSAGDAPSYKPSHARRPSSSAPKDLEPINEVAAAKPRRTEESESEKEDTVKANTVKEVVEVKEEPKPEEGKRRKKKKLVPNRAPGNNVQKESASGNKEKAVAEAEAEALSARSESESKSDRPNSARPLPVPKAAVSEGLPQKRAPLAAQARVKSEDKATTDSASSKSSSLSDGYLEETPRSMPNLSARDRRRKEKASSSMDNPPSARNVRLRKVPERSGSEKVTKKEKIEAPNMVAIQPRRQRVPSLQDSSSSDESLPVPDENTKDREKRRENKEMNNFICLLDNTLKMNNEVDKSEEEELTEVPVSAPRPVINGRQKPVQLERKHSSSDIVTPKEEKKPPPEEPAPMIHKSASMPSVETLTNTSRLMDRIRLLSKDCVQGVGYPILKKAYDILDHIEEDEVEPKLMDLLGKEKFDEYAGKIWQLKFCEESLFMS